ncbi:MAG: proline dehydrogenase family protein [Clostridia bacterium]
MKNNEGEQAALALKTIARDLQLKACVQHSELYPLLRRAASRYVPAETKEEVVPIAQRFLSAGYNVSLEYIGENTETIERCRAVKDECLQLIQIAAAISTETTISFDLSHIGLNVDRNVAYQQLSELAALASQKQITLMISAEEAVKTSAILEVYRRTASDFPGVLGITLQAQQHRSTDDLQAVMEGDGAIRLVKGAFAESRDVALQRSVELNERYLNMIKTAAAARRRISIATHDELILSKVEEDGLHLLPHVEIEMLHGIQPKRLKRFREAGSKARVYIPYGEEWYLYLCHRLAEYPPNLYDAVADLVDPRRTESVADAYCV